MSNLGGYQTTVTWMKRLGGPKTFWIVVPLACYVGGKLIEIPVRSIARYFRARTNTNQPKQLIEVTSAGVDSSGLSLDQGDAYRILYSDKDMVLIEKIGDTNNPYLVSSDFLHSISNYS